MPTPSRSRIFLSYRREDTEHPVGRLADDLRRHFSTAQIFEDIASIEPGTDFAEAVRHALADCAAVLVVIGPKWLTITDRHGRRRLDRPDDWVAYEVSESLREAAVRVFPVLVDAEMPSAEELPDSLRSLTRRQAFPLTSRHWTSDVATLVAYLKRVPGIATVAGQADRPKAEAPLERAITGTQRTSAPIEAVRDPASRKPQSETPPVEAETREPRPRRSAEMKRTNPSETMASDSSKLSAPIPEGRRPPADALRDDSEMSAKANQVERDVAAATGFAGREREQASREKSLNAPTFETLIGVKSDGIHWKPVLLFFLALYSAVLPNLLRYGSAPQFWLEAALANAIETLVVIGVFRFLPAPVRAVTVAIAMVAWRAGFLTVTWARWSTASPDFFPLSLAWNGVYFLLLYLLLPWSIRRFSTIVVPAAITTFVSSIAASAVLARGDFGSISASQVVDVLLSAVIFAVVLTIGAKTVR